MAPPPDTSIVITPDQLLEHWQGHRRVTRRLIDAFPDKSLFEFSLGGMRPFSGLVIEFLRMSVPTLRGIVTRDWAPGPTVEPKTKEEILRLWDKATNEINELWPTIPPNRFQEIDAAYGQWEGPVYGLMLYIIDNEIHHRGQGYVYLRALGIEPPPFYDRS